MGKIFYLITTRLYFILIRLVSPFNAKAKKMIEGRKGQWQLIKEKMNEINGELIWIHCASLGEFEQGRPVIEAIKKQLPEIKIILTFFSPSGYEVKKDYVLADAVFYLPFDTRKNAVKFLSLVKPKLVFFVKYEFWYHYLKTLEEKNIPVISFSTIFRPGQLFFRPYGGFYRRMLNMFDHIFVQNKVSEQLVKSIGIQKTTLAGDTRFDRVYDICKHSKDIYIAEKFINDRKVFVVGSSWPNDIDLLLPFFNKYIGKLKFIVAPHEINEKNLRQIEDGFNGQSVRFSNAANVDLKNFDVLIIDNIGMLSSLYKYGEYAYIGGSFNHGLHNTLEAATYGVPIFFGKSRTNIKYNEAAELLKNGGAFEVSDTKELEFYFGKMFENSDLWQSSAKSSREYVESNLGASEKIVSFSLQKLTKK